MKQPFLNVQDISVSVDGASLVNNVSFKAARGQITVITGPNGAGKSTLLRAVAGLLPVAAGGYQIDGFHHDKLSVKEKAKLLSYMPQLGPVYWPLTVEAIIALGQKVVRNDTLAEVMDALDIAHLYGRSISHLSGGERARVLLARAIVDEKPLVLLDEPTSALDPAHRLMVMDYLKKRARERNIAILMVMHDFALIEQYADHVLLMDHAKLIAEGTAGQALSDQMLRQVYHIQRGKDGHYHRV